MEEHVVIGSKRCLFNLAADPSRESPPNLLL